jgi:hypothetical protein
MNTNKSQTEQLTQDAVSKSALKFEYGFSSVNGIVKKHYYLHEIPDIKEKCDVWNVLPISYVRQFTGLKDKNGKEIYVGDWIQSGPGYCSVIEFKDGAFLSIYSHPEDGEELLITDLHLPTIEIVGNIYDS